MNFLSKKQSSIHCTHSLQKALALIVYHLHPLEPSTCLDLKFCFDNIIFNNELTLCITLPLHNNVIEKMTIIFLISICSVYI